MAMVSKSMMHPLLQKVTIDNSALFFRPGKMGTTLALIGRFLCRINAVCVEWMMSPLGIFIGSGTLTICFCSQVNVAVKKCYIVPESAIAALIDGNILL